MPSRRLTAVKAVRAETRPLFEVLVVYEDFVAGRRAGDTCSFLRSQLGDEFEFRCEMWKFEILRNPKLVEIAAAEALDADVIIVAARGAAPLPREVTNWIDRWLPLRVERGGALIAEIEGSLIRKRAGTPVYAYLEKVAATAKMDFLPHFFRRRGGGVSVLDPACSRGQFPPLGRVDATASDRTALGYQRIAGRAQFLASPG